MNNPGEAPQRRRTRLVALLIQACIALVLLFLLARTIDWPNTLSVLLDTRLFLYAAVIVAYFGTACAANWTTWLVCKAWTARVPFGGLYRIQLLGRVAGQILPLLGADIVRAVVMRRWFSSYVAACSAAVSDRLVGFLSRGVIVAVYLIAPTQVYAQSRVLADALNVVASALGVGVACVACFVVFGRFLMRPLGRICPPRVFERMSRFRDEILPFVRKPRVMLSALAVSVGVCVIEGLCFWALVHSVHQPVGLADAIVLSSAVSLISGIPVSISGLGLVEGATVVLLSECGADRAGAMAVAVLMRVGGIIFALGALPFCWGMLRDALVSARKWRDSERAA